MSTVISQRQQLAIGAAIKAPCIVATGSNCNLSGAQTIDGVAVVATSPPTRVLCFGQTNALQNGIYDVQTGDWTRSIDANGVGDFVQGTIGIVNDGTYADEWWMMTSLPGSSGWVIPGTDAMTFQMGIPSLGVLGASSGATLVGYGSYTVASFLNQLRYTGVITMLKNAAGAWCLFDQNSNVINISASTTQGLQEAINLSCTTSGVRGYPLEVIGGNPTTNGSDTITCTTPVTIPPLNGKTINFKDININITSAVGASNGLTIDSMNFAKIYQSGSKITYGGSGWAVYCAPINNIPGSGADMFSAEIQLGYISFANGATPLGALLVDPVNAAVHQVIFDIDVLDGGGVNAVGLQLNNNNTDTFSVGRNTFYIKRIIGFAGVGMQICTSSTFTAISDTTANKFYVQQIGGPGIGIDVYAAGSYYCVAFVGKGGTNTVGIQLESSATKNIFDVISNEQALVKCLDYSTTKDNVGMYGIGSACASVNLNAINQTGVLNNTATLVAFSNAVFNEGTSFDTASSKWIPARTGYARISASVTFTSGVTSAQSTVSIYKNGSSIASLPLSVSVDFTVPVTAVTDYFQIYVTQTSGSTQVISGANTATFANFEMINRR